MIEPGTDRYDLRKRTKQFSLRIIRLCASLSRAPDADIIRYQLLRSGTSPGAQYREACRARSTAEFVSKIESAEQEIDETGYWLELLEGAQIVPAKKLAPLAQETQELLRIFGACARTAKAKLVKAPRRRST